MNELINVWTEKPHDALPNYQTTGRHVVVNLHFDLHLNIAPEEAVGWVAGHRHNFRILGLLRRDRDGLLPVYPGGAGAQPQKPKQYTPNNYLGTLGFILDPKPLV